MINNSIKSKLFISLSSLITATLIVIAITSFIATRHEAEEIFDSNLVRITKLLLNLTKHEIVEHEINENVVIDLGLADERKFHSYERKIHFQIWKKDYLIYNSSSDIVIKKPEKEGFRDIDINNKDWKSFAIYDQTSELTVVVMERNDIRNELIINILLTLFLPLIISFIPILLMIWLVVNRSLEKLTVLSKEIKNVSPLFLKPFEKKQNFPAEIEPIIESLNFLLIKLEDSMNKERKFIDYASHELRTPLAVIKTKTQFLIKKHQHDNFLQNDLKNLLIAVNRMINLSNQLLTLSKIDTENKIVEKERVDLGSLVNKIVSNFNEMSQNKNINIIANIEKDCMIFANKFHIEIMLNNLIDNAIKYSPVNEDVELTILKKNNRVSFSIKNKGNTISSDDQKNIFERFFRAKNTSENGSGLGLSIVKRIADLHEATIHLRSENNYTWFSVEFELYPF